MDELISLQSDLLAHHLMLMHLKENSLITEKEEEIILSWGGFKDQTGKNIFGEEAKLTEITYIHSLFQNDPRFVKLLNLFHSLLDKSLSNDQFILKKTELFNQNNTKPYEFSVVDNNRLESVYDDIFSDNKAPSEKIFWGCFFLESTIRDGNSFEQFIFITSNKIIMSPILRNVDWIKTNPQLFNKTIIIPHTRIKSIEKNDDDLLSISYSLFSQEENTILITVSLPIEDVNKFVMLVDVSRRKIVTNRLATKISNYENLTNDFNSMSKINILVGRRLQEQITEEELEKEVLKTINKIEKDELDHPSSTVPESSIIDNLDELSRTFAEVQTVELLREVGHFYHLGDVLEELYEVRGVRSGGQGAVYFVYHKQWQTLLAMKLPQRQIWQSETGRKHYITEAETWAGLGLHPNLVTCYYVRTINNIPSIFIEFIDGGSLHDAITNRELYQGESSVVLARILDLAIQMARGLNYIHQKGLVHRDVKPGNVMLTRQGSARITDFGLARLFESGSSSRGGFTLAYASPEQEAGQPVTAKTDVWSLAVTLLEMFLGRLTWSKGSQAHQTLDIRSTNESTATGQRFIPAEISEMLKEFLVVDPANRPDMGQFCIALESSYRQLTEQTYPRLESKLVDLTASSLNNRAISFLDLGKEDDAIQAWQQALASSPQHFESNYNYGYYRWRHGQIDDIALVNQITSLVQSQGNESEAIRLLSLVHQERGDTLAIKSLQQQGLLQNSKFEQGQTRSGQFFLERRIMAHLGGVHSINFSSDGKWIVSGGKDNLVRVWETATGKQLLQLEGHTDWVRSVQFSPDNRLILSAGNDKTCRIWELSTGKTLTIFRGHTEIVNSARFSADGRSVISASDVKFLGGKKNYLFLWDAETGQIKRNFHSKGQGSLFGIQDIKSVFFSPDERFVLTDGSDSVIRYWDCNTGEDVRQFRGGEKTNCLGNISPDGRYIASASWEILSNDEDTHVQVFDFQSGKVIRDWTGTRGAAQYVGFSADSKYLLAGDAKAIRVWDFANGQIVRTLEHKADIWSTSFSPDEHYLATGSQDDSIWLWKFELADKRSLPSSPFTILNRIKEFSVISSEKDIATRLLEQIPEYINQSNFPEAYRVLREREKITGYEKNGPARPYLLKIGERSIRTNFRAAQQLYSFDADKKNEVSSLAFSPDSRYLATGGRDKIIRVWETLTGKPAWTFNSPGWVTSVRFHPSAQYIMSGGQDKDLHIWDLTSSKEIARLRGHKDLITGFMFTKDGDRVLSASWDKTLRFWDFKSGKQLSIMKGHRDSITCFAMSPDGRLGVSGTAEGARCIWELSSGKMLANYQDYPVASLAWSPDGKLIYSGVGSSTVALFGMAFSGEHANLAKDECSIRCWNPQTGQEQRRFDGHSDWITSLSVSPEGTYLLSGSQDASVRLWDASSGKLRFSFQDDSSIYSTCFSPNAMYAASSCGKLVRIWELDWDLEFE